MISPTKRQMDVLRFVAGYQEAHGGVSPALPEIAQGIGFSRHSKAATCGHINRLERLGFIRRVRNRWRAIEVLQAPAIPRDPQGKPLYFVKVGQ